MAEEHAHREAGMPVEDIDGVRSGLDGGNFVTAPLEVEYCFHRIVGARPGDALFGAQRGFRQLLLRRPRGDAAEIKMLNAGAVSGSEESPHVVHAAYIVQKKTDWRPQPVVSGGGIGSDKRNAFRHGTI